MRLAIISDTHDNLVTLESFLRWLATSDVGAVIHCGDIACAETMHMIVDGHLGPIHVVYGNADAAHRDEIAEICDDSPHATLHGNVGEVVLDGIRIGFCHFPDGARSLAETGDYDLVFHGHTHKPWEERVGDCRVINPGTLAGLFQIATFAIYDTATGGLQLQLVEDL